MDIETGDFPGPLINASGPAAKGHALVMQGILPAEDSLLDAIRALHAECMLDLTSATTTPTDIDWSKLLEPSDDSDCPTTITLKAVGLPDFGDPACNLVLIG
jgi:hypothetical protein